MTEFFGYLYEETEYVIRHIVLIATCNCDGIMIK